MTRKKQLSISLFRGTYNNTQQPPPPLLLLLRIRIKSFPAGGVGWGEGDKHYFLRNFVDIGLYTSLLIF